MDKKFKVHSSHSFRKERDGGLIYNYDTSKQFNWGYHVIRIELPTPVPPYFSWIPPYLRHLGVNLIPPGFQSLNNIVRLTNSKKLKLTCIVLPEQRKKFMQEGEGQAA